MTDAEQLRRAAVRAGIMGTHGTQVPMHKLEAFASILLDEENEACADLCGTWYDPMWTEHNQAGNELAEAIRARRKA